MPPRGRSSVHASLHLPCYWVYRPNNCSLLDLVLLTNIFKQLICARSFAPGSKQKQDMVHGLKSNPGLDPGSNELSQGSQTRNEECLTLLGDEAGVRGWSLAGTPWSRALREVGVGRKVLWEDRRLSLRRLCQKHTEPTLRKICLRYCFSQNNIKWRVHTPGVLPLISCKSPTLSCSEFSCLLWDVGQDNIRVSSIFNSSLWFHNFVIVVWSLFYHS